MIYESVKGEPWDNSKTESLYSIWPCIVDGAAMICISGCDDDEGVNLTNSVNIDDLIDRLKAAKEWLIRQQTAPVAKDAAGS